MAKYEEKLMNQRKEALDFITEQMDHAERVEKDQRRDQNEKNWLFFHGNRKNSKKRIKGKKPRVKAHLHKVGVAGERHRAKFKSNLMRFDKWMSVELEEGFEEKTITSLFAKRITVSHLERAKGKVKLSDSILLGEFEGRSVLRPGWRKKTVPRYVAKGTKLKKVESQKGQLDIQTRNFEEYYEDVDAVGEDKIWKAEKLLVDKFRVMDMAAEEPTADKPYIEEAAKALCHYVDPRVESADAAREGNEAPKETPKNRPMVCIVNFFGTILDKDGMVMKWENSDGTEVELRNVLVTIGLGSEPQLLRDPIAIPRWSGTAPLISADLLRSPGRGLKAIMDAGVDLNELQDALFELMITGALKSVHGVNVAHEEWITNKEVLDGGVKPNTTIFVSGEAPPGTKPFEMVETGKVPPDAVNMFHILAQAGAEALMTNQLDASGQMPGKQQLATELVQASQAIGDLFDSLAQDIEEELIEPFLYECFLEIMQNSNDLEDEEILAAFDGDQQRFEAFKAMTPQERFAEAANGFRFVAKGLRGQIASAQKAQSLINFLSTVMANPVLWTAIESQVSAAKLVKTIAKGLGLDEADFTTSPRERDLIEQKQKIREQAMAEAEAQGQQTAQPGRGGSASQQQAKQGSQPGPQNQM
jgi:hypothetical protein